MQSILRIKQNALHDLFRIPYLDSFLAGNL